MTRWGAAISDLLRERGWTQKQLAAAARIRPNTLTSIIRHGGGTDTRMLLRIADALDVDVVELFATPEQRLAVRKLRAQTVEEITTSVLEQVRLVRDLVARR